MDRGEIDAQGPAASRLPVPAVVHGEDREAVEHLRERAAHLREICRGAAFRAHVPRDGRPAADPVPELLAVLGDRQPPVPRGIALPSEQLHRPHAVHMGGASAGRIDDRLHRCSRFPEIFQIRQEVYPAIVQKMRSARKNLTSSTGYGEMGRTDGTPRRGVESMASVTRSSGSHTFGTRATQVRRPGAGRKRPPPFHAKTSPESGSTSSPSRNRCATGCGSGSSSRRS